MFAYIQNHQKYYVEFSGGGKNCRKLQTCSPGSVLSRGKPEALLNLDGENHVKKKETHRKIVKAFLLFPGHFYGKYYQKLWPKAP